MTLRFFVPLDLIRFRRLARPGAAVFMTVATAMSPSARADNASALEGIVVLSASATVEVTKDLLSVALRTNREGADAATVQAQLKQALDAALTEARKVASPGGLELHAGNFNVSPRYGTKGAPSGWQGSAELLIEGRDLQAIGQLTGRITTLTIARLAYNVSRELREKSEAEVSAEAIARYRARAAYYAAQFGYASYTIKAVEVTTGESGPSRLASPTSAMMRSMAPGGNDEPLPTEPGTAGVTVSVTGSVQLNR